MFGKRLINTQQGDSVFEGGDFNGLEYHLVTNPTTGRVWLDRNLGATQVATSSNDSSSYGDLYQWGRLTDGHQIRTSSTTSNLSTTDVPLNGNFITADIDWRSPSNDNLWQGVDGINNPAPPGFRLPTEAEWNAERLSWSSNNRSGAINSFLKLPFASFRIETSGNLYGGNQYGLYWCSTIHSIVGWSRILFLENSNAQLLENRRARGQSVRCIKD